MIIALCAAGFVVLLLLIALGCLFWVWLSAKFSGSDISFGKVLAMSFRGNWPRLIVDAYVILVNSGQDVTIDEVESIYIANKKRIDDIDKLIDIVRQQKGPGTVESEE